MYVVMFVSDMYMYVFFQSEIRYSSLGKHFLDQKQSGFVAMSISLGLHI